MSRQTVRYAAAAFLSNPQVSGVGTVFRSPPKISRSSDALAGLPAGTPSGSVIYIEILESKETRIGLGGAHSGKKMVTHTLRLHLLFRSRQEAAEAAMDDHDAQVETILARVRSDRTLGTAGAAAPVFQAGEGTQGITVATGMPKEAGTGTTLVWTLIDLAAQEIITT